jgi:hypothetical protein
LRTIECGKSISPGMLVMFFVIEFSMLLKNCFYHTITQRPNILRNPHLIALPNSPAPSDITGKALRYSFIQPM